MVWRQDARPLHQFRQVRRPRLHGRRRCHRRRPRRAKLGEKKTQFRLRDWGISRQRYWGCPIPIIHCDDLRRCAGAGRAVAGGAAGGRGAGRLRQPAQQARRLRQLHVPQVRRRGTARDRHHGHLRRVVVVLRALRLPRFRPAACSTQRANQWLPVDQYIGGIEHAILHLLYARFFHKLMRDEGLVSSDEPFQNLLTQGMVIADTFYREDASGKKTWFNPADVELRDGVATLQDGRCAGDRRRHREDVEVEEQRRRSAGADRPVRRRYRTPVHDVRRAAGAEPGMVGRRGGRRAPLSEAAVESGV